MDRGGSDGQVDIDSLAGITVGVGFRHGVYD